MRMEHLIFTRSTGARYLHYGRDFSGYPDYKVTDYIKSLDTGVRKTMSEEELKKFKTT